MRLARIATIVALTALAAFGADARGKNDFTISKAELRDKMRGAWAGQVIGCTYGGPTEFKYATTISPSVDIPWWPHVIKYWYDHSPYLYDDVYMDLTFVDVFAKEGLDAPIESFANAFAHARYSLWHANLQARYNILQGIMPPESGYWENNPHADDIDFQIEADFAGIMAPGMVNTATDICDGIGHMMNYGDGWYGGVYVAALYSYAFVSDDVEYVVRQALNTIPEGTRFHKVISDVIKWYEKYPEDWNICWALINRDHNYDIGCPEGVGAAYDIDAVLNSAYVAIGLLYGQKDFYKTIDISCRCGADSDCNPATTGGVLGTMLGFEGIPEYWRGEIYEVEDRDFPYTTISINRATDLSLDQALQLVERNGGKVKGDKVTIKVQDATPVRYEQCFENHIPKPLHKFGKTGVSVENFGDFTFDGNGVVLRYRWNKPAKYSTNGYVAEIECWMDGKLDKVMKLPAGGNGTTVELYYRYNLPVTTHTLSLKWVNKPEDMDIIVFSAIVYTDHLCLTNHDENKLKVATFNNQYENSWHPWSERRERVQKLIEAEGWDIVGMQEPFWNQVADMDTTLKGYAWVGNSTDGKVKDGYWHYNPIFYRTSRVEMLDWGSFWFSETPGVPSSKSWDAHTSRFCVWAHFRDKRTGKDFYHFNNHFDHKGETARQQSARLLLAKIAEIAGDKPFFVTGDFNTEEDTPAYDILVEGGLKDSFNQTMNRSGCLLKSWNDWKPIQHSEKPSNLDHLFVSEATEVLSWNLVTRQFDGQYPSDHFPVSIEWTIK